MKLTVEKCPAGRENAERDLDRIVDCSTTTKCYDYTAKKYEDSKCISTERCAKWSTGGGKERDGCIRKQYCQKNGNDVISNVLFDCGDGPKGCTTTEINDPDNYER